MSGAEGRETMRLHKANGTWDAYCKAYFAGTPAPKIADSITDWPRDHYANIPQGGINWIREREE